MPLLFHTQTITQPKFKIVATRNWLMNTAVNEGFKIKTINYIFMSDDELLQMNNDFLQHDYYTDIITFDNSTKAEQDKKQLVSDIFISVDRVIDNAKKHNTPFEQELKRVMVHGILHLCGYKDKSKADQAIMRTKENEALALCQY
jgi:probable rRNA maturation factor